MSTNPTDSFCEAEDIIKRMRLLGITNKQLAAELGVSSKSVYRYLHQKMPKGKEELINSILDNKESYHEYTHMTPLEFSDYLRKIFSVLDGIVTQEKIAAEMGVSQKYISTLMVSNAKSDDDLPQTTTKMQYDILSAVLSIYCRHAEKRSGNLGIFPCYPNRTIHELCMKLHRSITSDNFETEQKTYETSLFADYMNELDDESKAIILDNPLAFFDTANFLWLEDDEENVSVTEFFSVFMMLSPEQREIFRRKLEKTAFEKNLFQYYDSRQSWDLFHVVTEYRNMIKIAQERGIADPDYSPKPYFGQRIQPIIPDHKKSRYLTAAKAHTDFHLIVNKLIKSADEAYSDVMYKLKMSSYEWYLWMLFASYVYAMQEQESVYEMMNDVGYGFYDND